MPRKLSLITVTLAAAVVMMTAAYVQSAQKEVRPSGSLVVGVSTLHTESADPRLYAGNRIYLDVMYDSIIVMDDNGNFLPKESIAYKYEESPDHLAWTFYIRDGIKFQNGDPLGPEDVKFTIERSYEKGVVTSGNPIYSGYIEKVELAPPNKVVVHLKKPWAFLPLYLSQMVALGEGFVVPKKYIEKNGEESFRRHPVGSGAYRFVEYESGDHFTFEAVDYPHWRLGIPKFKTITFRLMKEEGTRLMALKAKEVDLVPVSFATAEEVTKAGLKLVKQEGANSYALLYLKTYDPKIPLSKLKVRQALMMAIDRKAILDHVFKGYGRLWNGAVSFYSFEPGYKEPPLLTPYDPEKAKRYLKEAGYPEGFTMYVMMYNITPEGRNIALVVSNFWESIGIKTKIMEMDYPTFRPYWRNEKDPPGPSTCVYAGNNTSFNLPFQLVNYGRGQASMHAISDKSARLVETLTSVKSMDQYIEARNELLKELNEQCFAPGLVEVPKLYGANEKVTSDWRISPSMYSLGLETIYRQK